MANEGAPGNAPKGWGVDLASAARPGVPREWPRPHRDPGAHWLVPTRQVHGEREAIERGGLGRITPVFGTAQPAHGLSGWIRRRAYRVPESLRRHWLLLVAADRVEVLGARLRRTSGALPLALLAAALGLYVARELRR